MADHYEAAETLDPAQRMRGSEEFFLGIAEDKCKSFDEGKWRFA